MSAEKLAQAWAVISIGTRKYAVNVAYIQAIIELSNVMFKEPYYSSSFVKGVYNIHNTAVNVLDGRKVVGEGTVDEVKLHYSEFINSIITDHKAWMDSVEWELITGEPTEFSSKSTDSKLMEFIDSQQSDVQIVRLMEKMRSPMETLHSMAKKHLEERKSGVLITDMAKIVDELRRQSENYIVKNLQKIIDINNDKVSEMCLVVKTKDVSFGISVDSIEMITEQADELTNTEKTRLSAGQITIKNKTYNILNLTKLAKVVE